MTKVKKSRYNVRFKSAGELKGYLNAEYERGYELHSITPAHTVSNREGAQDVVSYTVITVERKAE